MGSARPSLPLVPAASHRMSQYLLRLSCFNSTRHGCALLTWYSHAHTKEMTSDTSCSVLRRSRGYAPLLVPVDGRDRTCAVCRIVPGNKEGKQTKAASALPSSPMPTRLGHRSDLTTWDVRCFWNVIRTFN